MADALRYGGDASFAPFESLDRQGRPVGFQIDLMTALGRRLGQDVQVVLQPWERTEAAFRAGELDVIAMVDTTERRTWAHFLRSHATPVFAVYRRRGEPEPPVLTALGGRRIAVLAGPAMRDTLQTWLHPVQADWLAMPDAAQALDAVRRGQAEFALLPRAYADRVAALAGGAADVVPGMQDFRLQAYALAVAPGREDLAVRLQAALDALDADDALDDLRLRWLGSHRALAEQRRLQQGLTDQRIRTWGVAAGGVLGLSLLGAALWRRNRRVVIERARRLKAEQALQHAERLVASSFTHNPDPMLLLERGGGRVLDANDAMLALLDVPAPALLGQPVKLLEQYLDPDTLVRVVAALDVDGHLHAAPLALRRRDGALRDCLVSATPLETDAGTHLFCMVRDVTAQLREDAVLREGFETLTATLKAEQEAGQRAVQAARDGQVRAEQALQDFTRAVSHDLRSPLQAVMGFAGMLRNELQSGQVARAISHSEQIDVAARRMSATIDALTRLVQVTRKPLQRTTIDMDRLARDTWTLLGAAYSGRRVEGRIDPLPPAQGDPGLVAQIWQNLLDNAWKYTRDASPARVRVDSHVTEGRTWYRVSDNGAGFDASSTTVFVPFQRFHSAAQFSGTGIGLSLVRRIVDHHGGDIRVRSTPKVGTVIEFCLGPATAGATG